LIFAALTVVFVGLLLASEWKESVRGRWLTKPVASLGFICAGAMQPSIATKDGKLIFAALVLSAIGDVFLIPKKKSTFQLGVFAFLLAHLAFAAAFIVRGPSWPGTLLALVPLAVVAVPVARVVLPKAEDLKPAVAVYIVVVTVMAALAVGNAVREHAPMVAVAGLMFWCSDLAVARDTFIKPGFVNRAWGLPLYYAAQLVFALFVL
jgi:uncharacterized membrane protein YhhN